MFLFFSCKSIHPVYDPNIEAERYFRYAQEQRQRGRYTTAMAYYDIIIDNFAHRPDQIIVAEYEKGTLYFNKKQYTKAIEMFDKVIAKMQNPITAQSVRPSIEYLTRIMKEKAEGCLHKTK